MESILTEKIAKGAVISDLHLLSNRSTAHRYLDLFHEAAVDVDVFILNGDIFDFQWATQGGFHHSVDEAKSWLEELIIPHPDCTFITLLGNHDSIADYQHLLDQLQDLHPRFFWKSDYQKLGQSIFLHGDAFHARNQHELEMYRRQFNRQLRKHPAKHHAYWVIAKSGLLGLISSSVSKRRCARHLLRYLREEIGDDLGEIEDIYFGHVHAPFYNFEFRGHRFHNTGASLPFVRCETMYFECPVEDVPGFDPHSQLEESS